MNCPHQLIMFPKPLQLFIVLLTSVTLTPLSLYIPSHHNGLAVEAAPAPAPAPCFVHDRDALLAFKRGLSDPKKQLITWSISKSCCQWSGVTCDPSSGRVLRLVLSIRGGTLQLRNSSSDIIIGSTLSKLTRLEVLSLSNLASADGSSPLLLPAGLKALPNLKTLVLIGGGYSGHLPPEWSRIHSLQTLDLSSNDDITGPIPPDFCSLANLQRLTLPKTGPSDSQPALNGTIPQCLGNKLTKLVDLDLSYNKFTGLLPASIGNLVNLANLKLTGNLLTGPIPSSIGSLSSLKILNLGGNKFSGSIPQSLGRLGSLEELRIGGQEDANTPENLVASNKELGGTIPPGIGLPARSLRVLRIRGTSVSGSIPESIGRNNKLKELYLDGNALTGSIPGSLGLLKKLLTLNLGSNQLSGSIPAELAKPKRKLSTLNLSNNQLSGPIPATFSNLSLETLDLSNNKLGGDIPADLGNALKLATVNLANNRLTGTFPKSLWNARTILLSNNLLTTLPSGHLPEPIGSVQELNIASNQLSGTIPPWVFEFIVIFFIDLSNNKLVSPLPPIDLTQLTVSYVNISHNLFTGPIPEEWGNLRSLNSLDFSYNQFSGNIPSNFTASSTFFNNLVLSHNKLSGRLPDAIFNSGFYNSLDLSHNQLSGTIPDIFPDTTPFLSFLDLSHNQLSGAIPPKLFTYSSFIVKIKLDHNQFTGPIPDLGEACNNGLRQLTFVTLNDNKFTGSLKGASWIGECADRLSVYDISGNGVEGGIPDFSSWTNIQVLNLARNKFSGAIPESLFGHLPSLLVLDLSRNRLVGAPPFRAAAGLKAIGNASDAGLGGGAGDPFVALGGPYYQDGLTRTRDGFIESFAFTLAVTPAIDLSHNRLVGELAPQVGLLRRLRVLNLATNSFSGALPQSLGTLRLLKLLDVSHNSFSGRIPSGLQNFPPSSFAGNPQLCGRPLPVTCH